MKRWLILALASIVALAACSSDPDPETYYQAVSDVNNQYIETARTAFAEYQATIVPASDPTFEASFISGTTDFIGTMAARSSAVLSRLQELSPPSDSQVEHDRMLDAADLLSSALTSADEQISSLEVAADVNSVISQLPFGDLQDGYKQACADLQQKAVADESGADLACDEIGTL